MTKHREDLERRTSALRRMEADLTDRLFPLHPGDLVNIHLDGDAVLPAEVYAVPDGDAEPGDPGYVFEFSSGGARLLTEGFTAAEVVERVGRQVADLTDAEYLDRRGGAW